VRTYSPIPAFLQLVIDIDRRILLPVRPFIMGLLQVRQDALLLLRNNFYR